MLDWWTGVSSSPPLLILLGTGLTRLDSFANTTFGFETFSLVSWFVKQCAWGQQWQITILKLCPFVNYIRRCLNDISFVNNQWCVLSNLLTYPAFRTCWIPINVYSVWFTLPKYMSWREPGTLLQPGKKLLLNHQLPLLVLLNCKYKFIRILM